MQRTDLVAIRDVVPGDKNFIYATFLRGLYYGDTMYGEVPKDIFMEAYHKVLDYVLSLPGVQVRVACLKDDPEVVLGYAIFGKEGKILHWVFVKKAWRGIGLAKSLVPSTIESATHVTAVGLSWLRKHQPIAFNPFTLV